MLHAVIIKLHLTIHDETFQTTGSSWGDDTIPLWTLNSLVVNACMSIIPLPDRSQYSPTSWILSNSNVKMILVALRLRVLNSMYLKPFSYGLEMRTNILGQPLGDVTVLYVYSTKCCGPNILHLEWCSSEQCLCHLIILASVQDILIWVCRHILCPSNATAPHIICRKQYFLVQHSVGCF